MGAGRPRGAGCPRGVGCSYGADCPHGAGWLRAPEFLVAAVGDDGTPRCGCRCTHRCHSCRWLSTGYRGAGVGAPTPAIFAGVSDKVTRCEYPNLAPLHSGMPGRGVEPWVQPIYLGFYEWRKSGFCGVSTCEYSHLPPLQDSLTGCRGAGATTLAPATPAEIN